MTTDRRTAVAVLATVAVLLGAAITINALGAPFMADRGQLLWRLVAANTLGGLITMVGGAIAAGSVLSGSKTPSVVAGLMFLAVAGLTVIGVGQTWNLFGGRASTACFWLMLGIGLTVLPLSPGVRDASRSRP